MARFSVERLELEEANAFVRQHHRHHPRPVGTKTEPHKSPLVRYSEEPWMIAHGEKAEIYAAIDRALAAMDVKGGEVVEADKPFLFRGKMMPAGTYKVAVRFDAARGHKWLRVEARSPGAGPGLGVA